MMKTFTYQFLIGLFFISSFGLPSLASAQTTLHQDQQGVWQAKVIEIREQSTVEIPGTDVVTEIQTVEAEILEGEKAGERVEFVNDFIQLEEGETFFLNYLVRIDGSEMYSVYDQDRRGALLFLAILFAGAVILLGGFQGVRALMALAASLFVILYVLVPSLVSGLPPIATGVGIATLILFFAIFFTHGFNLRSSIAFGGTAIAVILTGLLAYFSVIIAGLTGFSSDETVYLNLNTGGTLDFVGLLIAAIMIGALGVLDDIAITQVAVVRELYATLQKTEWREVFFRAMRVGREHVASLVNTLVLAYTAAAMPLLLWFSQSESSLWIIVNREEFAVEIVRMIVGSIGIIMTVPIVTALAVFILRYKELDQDDIGEFGHGHHHH